MKESRLREHAIHFYHVRCLYVFVRVYILGSDLDVFFNQFLLSVAQCGGQIEPHLSLPFLQVRSS